jgi:hypothetical protein
VECCKKNAAHVTLVTHTYTPNASGMMAPLNELEVQMLLASFQSVLPSEKIGRLITTPWTRQSAATIHAKVHGAL